MISSDAKELNLENILFLCFLLFGECWNLRLGHFFLSSHCDVFTCLSCTSILLQVWGHQLTKRRFKMYIWIAYAKQLNCFSVMSNLLLDLVGSIFCDHCVILVSEMIVLQMVVSYSCIFVRTCYLDELVCLVMLNWPAARWWRWCPRCPLICVLKGKRKIGEREWSVQVGCGPGLRPRKREAHTPQCFPHAHGRCFPHLPMTESVLSLFLILECACCKANACTCVQ
jgi:hypothetical protein